MSRILLTLGSNTFAKTNIDKAKRMLTYLFPNIIFSDPILTEPEDDRYSYLFRNVLAVVNTDMSPEEVISKIKQTERAVGRTPRDKYVGKMVIDIDLVKYGDAILRPKDYEREYVQHLLATMDLPEEEDTILQSDTNETDAQAGVIAETDPETFDVQVDPEASDQLALDEAEPAETDVQKPRDQSDTNETDAKTAVATDTNRDTNVQVAQEVSNQPNSNDREPTETEA